MTNAPIKLDDIKNRIGSVREDGDFYIVHLSDKRIHEDYQADEVGELFNKLVGYIDQERAKQSHAGTASNRDVVVDLSDVEYFNDLPEGKLITFSRNLKSRSVALTVATPSNDVRESFDIRKLSKLFTVVPSLNEALLPPITYVPIIRNP